MNPVVVAMTGASGSLYGQEFLRAVVRHGISADLIVSDAAQRVAAEELGTAITPSSLGQWLGDDADKVQLHSNSNVGATVASGSYATQGMIVIPCSMGTLGRVAHGISSNLIERAADVQLKERRPLVVVPRETPLSRVHLQNMLRLTEAGATVLPAAPGFYTRPQSVADLVAFVVERAIAQLQLPIPRKLVWGGSSEA